jgi:predicted dehydrogenase
MLTSLIIGLGRAGAGLHLPALRRLPESLRDPGSDVLGLDPGIAPGAAFPGLTLVASARDAAVRTDPATTVVHLCTPPTARATVVAELAAHGFRRFLIEKPLAAGDADLEALLRVVHDYRLYVVPVSQWLTSALTGRIEKMITGGAFGPLRALEFRQRKPRFTRSLRDWAHPTAFDVEVPHALGVALTLAGSGRVGAAGWGALRTDDAVLPRLGTAWLTVAHDGGVRTWIESDLGSPVRERRIHARFAGGSVTGYYPCSEADHHAQLVIDDGRQRTWTTFVDDAITACLADAYRRFTAAAGLDPAPVTDGLAVNADVVRLLCEAKRHAERREQGPR